MDVQRAMRRNLERAWRQDQSIRRHDDNVRPRCSQAIERSFIGQLLRLKHFNAARPGQLLYRTLRWLQAAAGRPVRLREHERNVVPGVKQRRQRTRCELWSTGEY